MIYVFGDSHRAFFTNTHPGHFGVQERPSGKVRSATLGPGTAHNFYEKRHPEMMKILDKTEKKYKIIIVAGEIDCRLHIPKLLLQSDKRLRDFTRSTVSRLCESFIALENKGYEVIAWGPHPTRELERLDYNPEWYSGSQQLRNLVCESFNEELEKAAKLLMIPFVTLYNAIINDDYTVKDEYYRDPLHLNQLGWNFVQKELDFYT